MRRARSPWSSTSTSDHCKLGAVDFGDFFGFSLRWRWGRGGCGGCDSVAEGEPLGGDRSRRGIAGEQKLVAQRLRRLSAPLHPARRGSGAGSGAPNGSPVAAPRQQGLGPGARESASPWWCFDVVLLRLSYAVGFDGLFPAVLRGTIFARLSPSTNGRVSLWSITCCSPAGRSLRGGRPSD